MTKQEALDKGYCRHCAAWGHDKGWNCGVTKILAPDICLLNEETIERWKGEWGLEGATKRSASTDAFGDSDHQKPKRGRKQKRYLK